MQCNALLRRQKFAICFYKNLKYFMNNKELYEGESQQSIMFLHITQNIICDYLRKYKIALCIYSLSNTQEFFVSIIAY